MRARDRLDAAMTAGTVVGAPVLWEALEEAEALLAEARRDGADDETCAGCEGCGDDPGYICEWCGCWNPTGQACKYACGHDEDDE